MQNGSQHSVANPVLSVLFSGYSRVNLCCRRDLGLIYCACSFKVRIEYRQDGNYCSEALLEKAEEMSH